MKCNSPRSLGEEIFSSISHGIAVPLSIAGLVFLLIFANSEHTIWKTVGFSIFGGTLLFMYLMSTLFHALSFTKARKVFLALDQSAVFLLIAGTYTPFIFVLVRNGLGWTVFALIWTMAIAGLTIKAIFIDKLELFSLILYLLMGWVSILLVKPIMHAVSVPGILLMIGGGLFYTIGAVLYRMKKIPYNHAIWHLFVIAGSSCHYALMFFL